MSEQPQSLAYGREQLRQYELLRIILTLAGGAAFLALVLFVVLGVAYPEFPMPLTLTAGAFMLTVALSLALLRRGRRGWSVGVYLVSLMVVAFVAIYFANGVRGPMTVVLISIPVVAGLLGGRHVTRWVFLVGGLYLIMASLEALGVIQPREIGGIAERIMYHSVFVLAIAIIAYLVMAAARGTREALVAEEERGRQLVEANLQLERAAQAEAEARRREGGTALQLRQAVARYSDYLSQIAAGNYAARLKLAGEEVDTDGEVAGPVEELVAVGRQIEDTVQMLVETLSDLQLVQRRYVQESWKEFARTGFQRDYRYEQAAQEHLGDDLARDREEWLASMTETVRDHRVTASEEELGLPIMLRGELLGAIGLRRERGKGWSEAELALAETISDQLAQTMESLRLLDQTQRRAARDRLTGEVTARMRETLDIETVLKTTADEMFNILDADEVTVRLVSDDGG